MCLGLFLCFFKHFLYVSYILNWLEIFKITQKLMEWAYVHAFCSLCLVVCYFVDHNHWSKQPTFHYFVIYKINFTIKLAVSIRYHFSEIVCFVIKISKSFCTKTPNQITKRSGGSVYFGASGNNCSCVLINYFHMGKIFMLSLLTYYLKISVNIFFKKLKFL